MGAAGQDNTHYVNITNGIATLANDDKADTFMYLDFGAVSGVVEGYFELSNMQNGTNGFTPVQFYGNVAGSQDPAEIFGLRADKSGWKWRFNSTSGEFDPPVAADKVPTAASTKYEMHFIVDTTQNTITFDINGKVLASKQKLTTTGIRGIKFASGNTNSKTYDLDNIVITDTPVSLDTYKNTVKEKIIELDTAANLLKVENSWTLTNATEGTAAKLTAAKAMAEAAVDAIEATKETIDATYEAYEIAVLAALKAEYKARLASAYPAGSYNTNKTAYDEEIAKQNTAIDGVTSISGFITVYNTACDELDKIENDTAANIKNVTITVKSGDTTILTLNKKAGDNLTISDVKNEIKAPFGKQLVDLFEDSGFGTAVTSINMTVNEDTEYVYYAKFEDKALITKSLDVSLVPTTAPAADTLINDIFYITSKTKQESAKMNSGTYAK